MRGGGVGLHVALFLVLAIEGNVVDGGGFTGKVRFAGHVLHLHHFHVFHQGGNHVIEIGQLVAVGVHLEVIGVAHPGGNAVVVAFHDPGIQMGEVGLDQALEGDVGQRVGGVGELPVGHVNLVEHVSPVVRFLHVVVADGGGEGLHELPIGVQGAVALFGKVLMEGLQVMGGLEDVGVALPAVGGNVHQEAAVGELEGELEGVVVNHFEGEGIAGGQAAVAHVSGDSGSQLFVEHEVFNAELHVVHGDFGAVGPLQALAQGEGELSHVVVHFAAAQHVGDDLAGVGGGHGHQAFVHADEAVRVPVDHGGGQPQGAAVVADFHIQVLVQDLVGQLGLFGKTLFHGSQFAGFDLFVEHGGLGVGAFGHGGHCDHAHHQRQDDQPGHFLHGSTSIKIWRTFAALLTINIIR